MLYCTLTTSYRDSGNFDEKPPPLRGGESEGAGMSKEEQIGYIVRLLFLADSRALNLIYHFVIRSDGRPDTVLNTEWT